ncbi:MAG: aminotransferase class V-fold PLP-dependent enzyme, partial [Thermodesulfobacteriota bacterium]
LMEGLKSMDGVTVLGTLEPGERVSLVSFTIDGVAAEAAGMRLDEEFSIMVRCGTHCAPEAHRTAGTYPEGAVRVSPGYFNTPEDIEALLKAVRVISISTSTSTSGG